MFWILTPDPHRGYGLTYTSARDSGVLAEIGRASQMFASLQSADPPDELTEAGHHLCRGSLSYAWRGDPATLPQMIVVRTSQFSIASNRRCRE